MGKNLSSLLDDGPLLLDGGVGTEIERRGMEKKYPTLGFANALLTDPDLVRAVHEDYLRAGADIITTNTYSSPPERLEEAGLSSEGATLNQRAGTLAEEARKSVGREALIAGSLPPIRGSYRPDRVGSFEGLEPQYREQAGQLAPHVDLFLCETMSTVEEARAAVTGARTTNKPVVVSFTIADSECATGEPSSSGASPGSEPSLRNGKPLKTAIEEIRDLPVEGILLNCSLPESITAAMPQLVQTANVPAGGYANAFTGIPENWDEKTDPNPERRDDLDPEAYARYVHQWLEDGAQFVGGCCKTWPEHIAALRTILDEKASPSGTPEVPLEE